MLRSLALVSLSASLFWVGCSNDDKPMTHPPVLTGDMATGTGGNAGNGGADAGMPDMAMPPTSMDMGPALPDLAGLPAPDHDATQHPPLPRMTAHSTTTSIKAPEVWVVVWKGDDALGAKVQKFYQWMLGSDYWKKGTNEYGVGVGTFKGLIVLGSAPPKTITDGQLGSMVDNNIGKTGWPTTANANTIISFVLDPATTVTQGGQAASCVQFDGYHSLSPQQGIPYLVNAYCDDPTTMMPDWDNLTVTMSHETAEASTDGDLQHNRVVDPETNYPYLGGGEDGDMCISLNAKIQATATDAYLVQRLYSDVAAAANNVDPCLPDDGKFFGAGLYGTSASNPSVIDIATDANGNGSATIKIEPFSYDASFGPVGFYVAGSLLPTGITLTPDIAIRTENGMRVGEVLYGNPGSTTTVTVKVDSRYQPTGRPETFLVISRDVMKTRYNVWWGTINVQ
jgi:hypothetical protein